MTSRVAITGIGVIAPGAIGIDAFRDFLRGGKSAVEAIDRFDTASSPAHRAALVRGFNPREFIAPMKLRRMNALSRLLVSATRLAFDDGGPVEGSKTGVAVGTAFGPVQTSVDYMTEYLEKGAALASPQLFPESVANAPGSHAAIEWGLRGFNVTLTQRESSGLAAAMAGSSQLLKGAAEHALIGGVEDASEMLFHVLGRLGALAHGAEETARPFDRRRTGFVLGEGAAVHIASAAAGDREPYGYLAGFGMRRDTTAPLSDWGTDAACVAAAMRGAIEDAELSIADIDAVYASASGSIRGDRLEARALDLLFADRQVPVVATKGYFGEYAAGSILPLTAALLALEGQELHASCGFETGEDDVRLDIVRTHRAQRLRNVLVNSLSAGGGVLSCVVSAEGA